MTEKLSLFLYLFFVCSEDFPILVYENTEFQGTNRKPTGILPEESTEPAVSYTNIRFPMGLASDVKLFHFYFAVPKNFATFVLLKG